MAQQTYTVVAGDNLTKIAKKFNTTTKKLMELNSIIKDPNIIMPGWVLVVSGDPAPDIAADLPTPKQVDIYTFGVIANSDRDMYVGWTWDKHNQTDHYEVIWYYSWGVGIAKEEKSQPTVQYSTFTPPDYATHVTVIVKPVSKTYKDKSTGNDATYFEATWSTKKTYWFSENPPDAPGAPTVTIEDYTLTAELDNIDIENATHVVFQVVKDNSSTPYKVSGEIPITTNYASYSCSIDAGGSYKVRCKTVNGKNGTESNWGAWSGSGGTKPNASSGITICRAESETSIYLEWGAVDSATSYDLEYTTEREYFDGSNRTTVISGIEYNHYIVTGMESGDEYFFRVRAVNSEGESAWSGIKSVVIGTAPAAPTTWSSTTTVVTGESLNLYWVHNSEDNSTQTKAEIELTINGTVSTHTINTANEEDDEKTMHYSVSTTGYAEGAVILWRVRTAGATGEYGEWSIQRRVDLYAPPTLSIAVKDLNGAALTSLTSFPFSITGVAGPSTQTPIGYQVTITAKSYYETLDVVGNPKVVNAGDVVYSKYFDISVNLYTELSAGDIDLENNIEYEIVCMVSMDSGLTATTSYSFTVAWVDEEYAPNASIGINRGNLTATIGPYCKDASGNLVDGITLSVYRREFDGTFTELATGLSNVKNTHITDPHPSLDYARYRIVAISDATGAVSYYDMPGHPVGEEGIIIQWNEAWKSYVPVDGLMVEPNWGGTILRLPYNVDISDDYSMDVSLIEYIGRNHPVSYYGTQRGETSTWSTVIPKTDRETLYALRRLAIWPGDVYVREPSGSGYWAHVSVSFSQKHLATTIPIQLGITRVAGGV